MMRLFFAGAVCAAVLSFAVLDPFAPEAQAAPPTSPLQFTVKNIDGAAVPLSKYKNEVVLIVNTASLCGNTPQYASLEKLYQKYNKQGLRILAFPANNFGAQEPGSNADIKAFCTKQFHVTFDVFGKVSVAGADQAPLYQFLTDKTTNPQFAGPIEWNFAKFLVGRDGKVIARFPAGKDPLTPEVVQSIEAALKSPAPKK